MAIQATRLNMLTVKETISGPAVSGGDNSIQHAGFNRGPISIAAATSPPGSIYSAIDGALTAGSYIVDLKALPVAGGETADASGMKVQLIRFRNTSAAAVTIGPAGSDEYEPFGAATTLTVPAGAEFEFLCLDNLGDVGGSAYRMEITGAGTETFRLEIIAG